MDLKTLSKIEVEIFQPAKQAVIEAVAKLKPMVFTDKRGRDGLFNACVDANKIKTQINKARLQITKPLDDKKKEIKALFDSLTDELEAVIAPKRTLISAFDAEAKRKADEEARRLQEEREARERKEREEREARERKEREEREARERKEREERERIEEEARKKREEAAMLTGIAKKKAEAKAEAERKARQEAFDKAEAERKAKAESERIQREADEKIRREKEEAEFKRREKEAAEKANLKGSKKAKTVFILDDITKVPPEYLKTEVDWPKVNHAAYNGVKEIPGFHAEEKQGTVFAGRA